jgi:hypothetical protein
MENRIKNFLGWKKIFESNGSWPSDLESFEAWKILSDMGSTYEVKKNNFWVKTPDKTYVLTSGGYIRDPERYSTSNSIVADFRFPEKDGDQRIQDMLFWIAFKTFPKFKDLHGGSSNPKIKKLEDLIKNLEGKIKKIDHPYLSRDQVNLLRMFSDSWSYDEKSGGVEVDYFDVTNKSKNPLLREKISLENIIKILKTIKFTKGNSFNLNLSQLTSSPNFSNKYQLQDLKEITDLPESISGSLYCSGLGLITLKGSPREVGWDFYCSENNLTSLEGAPRKVGRDFDCSKNKLTSLKGAPLEVNGSFFCSGNKLTSLEGAPREVRGNFTCYDNKLTSLEGAPGEVRGNFTCEKNPLQTLVGAPRKIGGRFLFSAGVGAPVFVISGDQWGPAGWLQALKTIGDPKARDLVLTLLDPKPLLAKLKGDLKQDGPVLLDLSYLWGVPGAESIQKELEASLTPVQLKSIQALRKMHGYL